MSLKQIEEQALKLSEDERAVLAQKLLLSIDTPSPSEIENDWLAEAYRRARELDEGIVKPIERMLTFEQERPHSDIFMCRDTFFWIDGP